MDYGVLRIAHCYLLAISRLLLELLLRSGRPLDRSRLRVTTKGVDKTLLVSSKNKMLRAFIDGSALSSGDCGLAVFYSENFPLNYHGGFHAGEPPAESNLAELAAVYWTLLQHPRGQELSIFSDSVHALRVVQAVSAEESAAESSARSSKKKARRGREDVSHACPRLDKREAALARGIWWLLRLRTAMTSFYKVPAHKGFTQNHVADALARKGAESVRDAREGQHDEAGGDGSTHDVARCDGLPINAPSVWTIGMILLRYLLSQSEVDGGLGGSGLSIPIGPSTELTPVLALDCEMVGCGAFGSDSRLASVSIVNDVGNQVYFSYSRPGRPVVDYRTKYSGVTRQHLEGAPSQSQVREEVRRLVAGRAVVGHSLENDFRVLGFFPPRSSMRDTAHDVPRLQRNGRPRKLRRLAWEFLGLTIQDSESGHDPLEDARASLLLYLRFKPEFEARAVQHAAEAAARHAAEERRTREKMA